MASDPLYELLYPSENAQSSQAQPQKTAAAVSYTARLSTLSVSALTTTEPESLNYDAQSLLRSLQALAKRSYKSINSSADSLSHLHSLLPSVARESAELQSSLPALQDQTLTFAQKYARPLENPTLEQRRRIMRLDDNVERVSSVLELPTLLYSTIAASAGAAAGGANNAASSTTASYASALDLYAHIKRLQKLYPDSNVIQSVACEAGDAMSMMTTRLITSLRSQNLKLAGAMRLIGLLRRVAPELGDRGGTSGSNWSSTTSEGTLGALFLVCRIANLETTIEALEPLRELADQETANRLKNASRSDADDRNSWAAGQQTERYLKRYVEVFREQCFAIISMFNSIFPVSLPAPMSEVSPSEDAHMDVKGKSEGQTDDSTMPQDPMQQIPSALSAFAFEVVDKLIDTLRDYMPNLIEQSSRDSLLTQVLYCASSMGRLGGDFGMMLALLEEEVSDAQAAPTDASVTPEWVGVMKRHRIQASKLELLASGVGKGSHAADRDIASPA